MALRRTQRRVAAGMVAGLVWSIVLLVAGPRLLPMPAEDPLALVARWLLIPGLVLLALIARLAQARFFDQTLIDGQDPRPGTSAAHTRAVLQNTLEQAALAVLVWPALALNLAPDRLGVIPCLAVGFGIARLAFWAGYAGGAATRAFGFAATYYPTAGAALWAIALAWTR